MKRGGIIGDKKGLSPTVASILLILLVLVLAALLFLWARGFISEQIEKFGKPVEELCAQVDFEVARIATPGKHELEVVNRGNVDIYHLDIKLINGGNSETMKFRYVIDSGDSVRESISLKMSDGKDPEKVIVYPALIGKIQGKDSNKVFTCIDHGKTINL